ncbi:LxmA leader domain family RiPP [Streptomyces sp. NPDC048566]|uniref:LxmA leader domain family RiPP n=1 Tax=Streptomyces sp. NPDC048566 TaxID=3365569 RepID=UPI003717DB4E
MSTQNLMSGFDAYTDAAELAAEPVNGVAEEQSTPTITITVSLISVVHTYDTGC